MVWAEFVTTLNILQSPHQRSNTVTIDTEGMGYYRVNTYCIKLSVRVLQYFDDQFVHHIQEVV